MADKNSEVQAGKANGLYFDNPRNCVGGHDFDIPEQDDRHNDSERFIMKAHDSSHVQKRVIDNAGDISTIYKDADIEPGQIMTSQSNESQNSATNKPKDNPRNLQITNKDRNENGDMSKTFCNSSDLIIKDIWSKSKRKNTRLDGPNKNHNKGDCFQTIKQSDSVKQIKNTSEEDHQDIIRKENEFKKSDEISPGQTDQRHFVAKETELQSSKFMNNGTVSVYQENKHNLTTKELSFWTNSLKSISQRSNSDDSSTEFDYKNVQPKSDNRVLTEPRDNSDQGHLSHKCSNLRETSACSERLQETSSCSGHLQETSSCSERLQETSSCSGHLQETSSCSEHLQETSSCSEHLQETSSCSEHLRETSSCSEHLQETSSCSEHLQETSSCFEHCRSNSCSMSENVCSCRQSQCLVKQLEDHEYIRATENTNVEMKNDPNLSSLFSEHTQSDTNTKIEQVHNNDNKRSFVCKTQEISKHDVSNQETNVNVPTSTTNVEFKQIYKNPYLPKETKSQTQHPDLKPLIYPHPVKPQPRTTNKLSFPVYDRMYQMTEKMKSFAEENNFEICDVSNDGNCMFASVVDQLRINGVFDYTTSSLRHAAVSYLRQNPYHQDGSHLRSFLDHGTWEEYLRKMGRDAIWGDHLVLTAIVEVIQRQITVYNVSPKRQSETTLKPKSMMIDQEQIPSDDQSEDKGDSYSANENSDLQNQSAIIEDSSTANENSDLQTQSAIISDSSTANENSDLQTQSAITEDSSTANENSGLQNQSAIIKDLSTANENSDLQTQSAITEDSSTANEICEIQNKSEVKKDSSVSKHKTQSIQRENKITSVHLEGRENFEKTAPDESPANKSSHNSQQDSTKYDQLEALFLGHYGEEHFVSLRPKNWEDIWYKKGVDIRSNQQSSETAETDNERMEEHSGPKLLNQSGHYNYRSSCTSMWKLTDDVPKSLREDNSLKDSVSSESLLHLSFIMKMFLTNSNIYSRRQFCTVHSSHKVCYFESAGSIMEGLAFLLADMSNALKCPCISYTHRMNCPLHIYVHMKYRVRLNEEKALGENDVFVVANDTQPGYLRLQKSNVSPWESSQFRWYNNVPFLKHLPAHVLDPYRKCRVISGLRCSEWPDEAAEWITRDRPSGWPTSPVIQEIYNHGCLVAAVPYPFSEKPELQWRYLFNWAEKKLANLELTTDQKYCFSVFKVLVDCQTRHCNTKLSTSHLRTIFFHACEVISPDAWIDNSAKCVLYLINNLYLSLKHKYLPHYFIKDNNIIGHFTGEIIQILERRIDALRTFPTMSLVLICQQHSLMLSSTLDPILDAAAFKNSSNMEGVIEHVFVPTFNKLIKNSVTFHQLGIIKEKFQGLYDIQLQILTASKCTQKPSFEEFVKMMVAVICKDGGQSEQMFACVEQILCTVAPGSEKAVKTMGDIMGTLKSEKYHYVPAITSDIPADEVRCLDSFAFQLFMQGDFDECALFLRSGIAKTKEILDNIIDASEIDDQEVKQQIETRNCRLRTETDSLFSILYDHLSSCYQLSNKLDLFMEHMADFEKVCERQRHSRHYFTLSYLWSYFGNQQKVKDIQQKLSSDAFEMD